MIKNVFPLNEDHGIDLTTVRQLVKEGSNIDLSVQEKGPNESVIVLAKMMNPLERSEQTLAQQAGQVLGHFYERFAILCRWKDFEHLYAMTPGLCLTVHTCKQHDDTYLCFATGDLHTWIRICCFGCTRNTPNDFRWICNQIWDHLTRVYGDVLSDWTKDSNHDGTFILSWSQQHPH